MASTQSRSKINTPTRQQVVFQMYRLLQDGKEFPSGILPSERVLAERLGVSRPTLRTVLQDMEEQGKLEWVGPHGRRLLTDKISDPKQVLAGSVLVLGDMQSVEAPDRVAPGWESHTLEGVVYQLQQLGCSALVVPPALCEGKRLDELLRATPQGAISPHCTAHEEAKQTLLRQLSDAHLPIVVRDEATQDESLNRVGSDQDAGAHLLTSWLLERGYRHIVRVEFHPLDQSESPRLWREHRHAGYRRAVRAAGLEPLDPLRVEIPPQQRDVIEQFPLKSRFVAGHLAELFARHPEVDALMMDSDGPVFSAAAALRMIGREPNKDVALVGYDNYWAGAPERDLEPTRPLATVDKDNFLIGVETVKLLEECKQDQGASGPQRRLIKPRLLVVDEPQQA